MWVCFAISIIVEISIVCFNKIARKVPYNYILLTIFTLTFSYTIGCITAFYPPKIVLTAVILTTCATLGLTL